MSVDDRVVVGDASGDVAPVLTGTMCGDEHVVVGVFPDAKKDNTHGMEAFVSRAAARRFARLLLAMTEDR